MKAMMLREIGETSQLKLEEVETPKPDSGEVVIKLKAAALNRRDLMVLHGQYPGIKLPAIPGSDGAGEIVAVGNEINNISTGDKVIINPGLNWGNDMNKKRADFTILGVPSNGTYAQYVKVPAENVYPKPSHLSWEEAAALPLAGLTAYRAMVTKGKVTKGENVLIPGVGGGVATYLVQFASALGANVYVTSSKEEKINKAKDFGATEGVNYTAENWTEELENLTGGIDLSVDSIAGEMFKTLISLGKIGSRIVSFGATRGPVPNLILPTMTVKEISVIGSTMGSPQDFADMVDFVEKHEIHPILDKTYSLEEAPEALARMEKGENFGKIVLSIPQD
ncbi:quinone oxidoreductase family protein [Oceanobacillus neutriphilus]|uniref:Alcohol dehydrogenase n=1 Tax=Oceanobacillus neutriphilus TaxID=531815 RepID=A0ABQ2NUC3_9BACI|nr:zinc-binding dehydrogenase [Oceanobacillus neutriphilus]GGP10727.1 alcohol dehydrogenase [Oceanobacillus neutriphilus]